MRTRSHPRRTVPRDLAPDVLRGFALFGIALVNVAFFAIDPALGAAGPWVRGAGNTVAAFLVWALAQGKFYLLFSFLFGYSSQYVVRGDPARRSRWIARAFALLALGALHGALLFHGDILFAYGLLALPFGGADAPQRRRAAPLGVGRLRRDGRAAGAAGAGAVGRGARRRAERGARDVDPGRGRSATAPTARRSARARSCGWSVCRRASCSRAATPS